MGKFNTKYMAKNAVLSVIAFLLMLLEIPLWFTPEFLKMDLSDLPAVIAAFAMGPIAGIIVESIKVILKIGITSTATAGVGELANFLVGSIFSVTAAIIYRKNRNKKNILLGLIAGTVVMSVVASILNYIVLLPFYSKAYGLPLTVIVDMAKSLNSYVVDLRTFIAFGIFPFNIFKGIILTIITYAIYTRVRTSIEID
ncbi:MAG: ECF transporter S component [Andreesenia angusta]|nr:ECF transporter S component [Andreesenia angusta]